jgi:hypothetical protein
MDTHPATRAEWHIAGQRNTRRANVIHRADSPDLSGILKDEAESRAGVVVHRASCYNDGIDAVHIHMGERDAISFGIVYTDYPTLRRILKDSALWCREVITPNGARLSLNSCRNSARCRSWPTGSRKECHARTDRR